MSAWIDQLLMFLAGYDSPVLMVPNGSLMEVLFLSTLDPWLVKVLLFLLRCRRVLACGFELPWCV